MYVIAETIKIGKNKNTKKFITTLRLSKNTKKQIFVVIQKFKIAIFTEVATDSKAFLLFKMISYLE